MAPRTARRAAVLVMVAVLGGCAYAGSSGGRDPDRITRAEMDRSNQTTVLDLIQSARPGWLRLRGPSTFRDQGTVFIYVDGVRHGTLSDLRSIQLAVVEEVRRLDSREATNKYGTGHPHGAIEVDTRQR